MKRHCALVLLTICVSSVVAAPPPPMAISKIIKMSDLIVVGTLKNITSFGGSDVRLYSGVIETEKCIYGKRPNGEPVVVQWETGPHLCDGYWEIKDQEGEKAVWLLIKNDEQYSFIHWNGIWFFRGRVLWYPSVDEALMKLKEERRSRKGSLVIKEINALLKSSK